MTSLISFVDCEFVMLCSPESEHFMHYLFVCLSVSSFYLVTALSGK